MTETTESRAAELMRLAARYIRDYAPDRPIEYDGTTCDGYCLADDLETWAEEVVLWEDAA